MASCALAASPDLGFVSHLVAELRVHLWVFSGPYFAAAPFNGAKILCEFARLYFRVTLDGAGARPGLRFCLKVCEC